MALRLIVAPNVEQLRDLQHALTTLLGDTADTRRVFTANKSGVAALFFSLDPLVVSVSELFFDDGRYPSIGAGVNTLRLLNMFGFEGISVYYGEADGQLDEARRMSIGGKPVVVLDSRKVTPDEWARRLIELEPRLTQQEVEPVSS